MVLTISEPRLCIYNVMSASKWWILLYFHNKVTFMLFFFFLGKMEIRFILWSNWVPNPALSAFEVWNCICMHKGLSQGHRSMGLLHFGELWIWESTLFRKSPLILLIQTQSGSRKKWKINSGINTVDWKHLCCISLLSFASCEMYNPISWSICT